jgi:hypothetical protein
MAVKTRSRGLSGHPARRADQLADTDLRRAPRCECLHPEQCRRVARFRLSELCAERTCGCAVSVYLACADCKDAWVSHAQMCSRAHKLRVTPI